MPMHLWSADVPSGVYKNHSLSNEMFEKAVAKTVFVPFSVLDPAFGKGAGETHDLIRGGTIAVPSNNGVLTEGNPIPLDTLALSKKQITIQEYGRGVEFTSKIADLSKFDLPAIYKKELMRQLRLAMDQECADQFTSSQIKYVPTGSASRNITTNGTASGTAAVNLNFFHIEEGKDYLQETLLAPGVTGEDDYVMITNIKGARGIRRDPNFVEWNKYAAPDKKFTGELGKIENIRFVVTNNTNALPNSGSSSVLGEAVLFGDDAVAHIMAMEPELRMNPGVADFGRKLAVAWYGMFRFAIIWDTGNAGEARVVHYTSA